MSLLGKQVRDKVSGLEGFCTGRAEYVYANPRCCVTPKANQEEGRVEEVWFDESRLESIGQLPAADA